MAAEQVPSVEEGVAQQKIEVHSDGSNWQNRPNADKIICPFLKALYQNGDLVPDEEGVVSKQQQLAAMAASGLVDDALGAILVMNSESLKIFEMDGNNVLEHTLSTGILDPLPNPEKFKVFAAFADKSGRFYAQNFQRAFWHFCALPNERNKERKLPAGTEMAQTWGMILDIFGQQTAGLTGLWKGKYLTVEQLRGYFLEGKYPSGWKVHPWSSMSVAREVAGIWGPCACCRCCCRRRQPRDGEQLGDKK